MSSMLDTDTTMAMFHANKLADIQGRIDAHQQTMARRGPEGLNLVATGDSWFDYPLDGLLPGINTDVLAQLKNVCDKRPEILSLAHYGYTSTQEMGLARQKMLVTALTDPANGKFDAILMSGGGNDIAGDALVIWLNDSRTVGGDYGQAINMKRLAGAVNVIKSSYYDVIAIRDEFAPGTPIFAHSYDYPIVNGKGVCTLGPWLKPAFDFCNWTDEESCNQVITQMMKVFALMLDDAASEASNFIHVKTQGTITANQWCNELHPDPEGFRLIAGKFKGALSTVLAGCV